MKKFSSVILIFLLISTIMVMADGFKGMWKDVNNARVRDLPATQIEMLDKIITKARNEKSYGNLMKAVKERLENRYKISPDSFNADVERLEQETEETDTNSVLYAVYNSVLGSIYREKASMLYGDNTGRARLNTKSKDFFKKSLGNPTLLAGVKTGKLYPFFSKKKGNDLLISLSYNAMMFETARDYYVKSGNRPCALIMSLECIRNNRHDDNYINSLDSLIAIYGDIEECCEAAIAKYNYLNEMTDTSDEELIKFVRNSLDKWGSWKRSTVLKNAELRLTRPSFEVVMSNSQIAENERLTISLNKVRNIGCITTRVWKTRLTTDDVYKKLSYGRLNDDFYKAVIKGSSEKEMKSFDAAFNAPDYKFSESSFNVENLDKGIYIIETTCNVKGVEPCYNILYVSNLFVITESLPDDKIRMAVVDSRSGQPVSNATLNIYCRKGNSRTASVKKIVCDTEGEIIYNDKCDPVAAYAQTDNDEYMSATRISHRFSFRNNKSDNSHTAIFTDRAVYRPGQTVKIAVVKYRDIKGCDMAVEADKKVNLTIKDANYKVIAKKELKTDEYGKASTEFILPSKTLNGTFRIADDSWNYTTIRVEQYKRPTFRVELTEPSVKYNFGDTVKVSALATSYAGVPVQGASVKYRIKRVWLPWLRFYSENSSDIISQGTTVTSGEGSFAIDVPLKNISGRNNGLYYFIVEADVNEASGESQRGKISIPVSNKEVWLDCDMPEKIEKGEKTYLTFNVKNVANKDLDTEVTFSIDGKGKHKIKSNEEFLLSRYTSNLSSGKHRITAEAMGEKIEKDFVLFSLSDKVPATKTDEWFYITSDTFPEDGRCLSMQIGSSSEDVHMFYTVISGNNILKIGTESLSNEVKTYELKYKEEYGDGILISYAWVKNGKLFSGNVKIKKPLPNKNLNMKWITFRDRLTPGQKEQWTLEVSRQDGFKADASITATLYDMSLDNIIPHSWNRIFNISRRLPYTSWNGTQAESNQRDYIQAQLNWLKEDVALFERFPEIDLCNTSLRAYDNAIMPKMGITRRSAALESTRSNDVLMKETTGGRSSEDVSAAVTAPQLRENFSETAFFYPSLTTDNNGKVNISFTLPESTTTWKFMAFANDKEMRNEVMKDEIIARKKVMVQPNIPRFIRSGDKAAVSARISNLSEKDINGNAVMQICDAETNNIIIEKRSAFNIKKDGSGAVTFNFDADMDADIVVCKIFAEGKGYSDGEQHYLGILSDKEVVTNTRVMASNVIGTFDIYTDGLFGKNAEDCRFTLEYTDNPAWFAIQALPNMTSDDKGDVITTATQIYANTLAKYIATASPEIKRIVDLWDTYDGYNKSLTSRLNKNEELKDMVLEETPWVIEAEAETEQKHRIAELFDENAISDKTITAINKLKEAQYADGSWGWWRGMGGNVYITGTVAEILSRLEVLTGHNEMLSSIIDNAITYLSEKTAEQVKLNKDNNGNVLTSTNLRYLYIKAIRNAKLTEADRWLMERLYKYEYADMNIYEKCMAAIILDKTGNKKKAIELINSVMEYTVYNSHMGRFFDSPYADYSWFDYRIPTQVMAIEAIRTVTPAQKATIAEMQQWLLNEKRTTSWSTPLNSVNAIYALTNGGRHIMPTSDKSVITLNGRKIEGYEAGTGYVKATAEGKDINLNVYKKKGGMSWLSLYGTYTADIKDIEETSTGLKINREIITAEGNDLKVGDRIKVRITINAERDYDFVQVTDKRAACMEPVNQISGYNGRYYCSMKDNAAYYYFDMMPKGTHVIETEYYVDRSGSYTTGTCRVQCAYAPEFNGRTEAGVITVK